MLINVLKIQDPITEQSELLAYTVCSWSHLERYIHFWPTRNEPVELQNKENKEQPARCSGTVLKSPSARYYYMKPLHSLCCHHRILQMLSVV